MSFFTIMPRLHLPYDEYMMPVRCPNHRFRAVSAGRPCDHCTDLWGSWPLRFFFNSAQWQIWKNRKPVARRHIAVTPYDPRTGTAWGSLGTTQGFRLSSCPKNDRRLAIVVKARKVAARCLCRAYKLVRTSDGHPVVTPRRWHDDRAVALRRVNNFQTYH